MKVAATVPAPSFRSRLPSFRHFATFLGVAIVGTAVLVAIFAPYLTPHDPFAQNLNLRMVPPVWMDESLPDHLLGTDQLGRDYLSRLIYGARISLMIGMLTVVTSGLIGITLDRKSTRLNSSHVRISH